MPACQLFISYNSQDRYAVTTIQVLLEARGITTFLDRNDLLPGRPWPQALEQGLREASAAAVFIGREFGAWQKREMWFALDRQARDENQHRPFPVIPVLLPGADTTTGFLFLNSWVDFRHELTDHDALLALERAVRGDQRTATNYERICPYRGLNSFREEDSAFFAGRKVIVDRLVKSVLREKFIAVVGPSGSGKSSVVMAGLVPLLRRQRPPQESWDFFAFTPGARPFHRLAGALISALEPDSDEVEHLAEARRLGDYLANSGISLSATIERLLSKSKGTDRLLIVVDQFEEIFTLASERTIKPFIEELLEAQAQAPITLLVTLRADFYGYAMGVSRQLSDCLEQGIVNLSPMVRPELREAIETPAKRVGLTFEAGLVERILDDAQADFGSLPQLEFSLTELWEQSTSSRLTHDTYDRIGRISGAVTTRAEREFLKLTSEQQTIARRLFTRLVRVGKAGEGGDTRQRTEFSRSGVPCCYKTSRWCSTADDELRQQHGKSDS